MRYFTIIVLAIFLLQLSACKTTQKVGNEKVVMKIDSLKNGAKELYLLKNKKLEVVETNGQFSYAIVDSDKSNVVQYVYAINQDQVAYDGGYKEEILFEVPNDTAEENYTDSELQNTKMLFGRYCYCRGKNGIFKVNKGKLHLKTSKKETHFELQFKINEVPQETEKIDY